MCSRVRPPNGRGSGRLRRHPTLRVSRPHVPPARFAPTRGSPDLRPCPLPSPTSLDTSITIRSILLYWRGVESKRIGQFVVVKLLFTLFGNRLPRAGLDTRDDRGEFERALPHTVSDPGVGFGWASCYLTPSWASVDVLVHSVCKSGLGGDGPIATIRGEMQKGIRNSQSNPARHARLRDHPRDAPLNSSSKWPGACGVRIAIAGTHP